ncbi:MAG: glycoside hydrolase family 3 protein, partial [Lachnospiraceae bacterium]|nr:glycoside hydrolase family 3 protein [Lachnospiraceae bacterium]
MEIWKNKAKVEEYRERAKALVSHMTLEEKVGQTLNWAPAVERLGIKAYNWWNEALHGVARAGVATVFPQSIGLAATFDEDLLEEVATAISTEGRAKFNAAQEYDDTDIYKGLTFWSPN